MTTPHEIRTFVGSTRPKNWYGLCAGLTYRTIADCGGYAPDIYGSAFAAYLATEVESRNPRDAPPGAIHYWDYSGTDDRGRVARWGHVAIDIYGGGHQVLSATGYAHEWWGVKAGLITVEAQTARGMPYLGWSRTYGRRNRLTISNPQPAVETERPLPVPETPKRKKRIMIHAAYRSPNGTIAIQARPGGRLTELSGPDEWNGLVAATGAEYFQCETAEQYQAIGSRFGGFLDSPNFDDARTGQGATILVPVDGQPDRYATIGDRAYWIDQATMDDMLAKGAVQVRVPREEITARTT